MGASRLHRHDIPCILDCHSSATWGTSSEIKFDVVRDLILRAFDWAAWSDKIDRLIVFVYGGSGNAEADFQVSRKWRSIEVQAWLPEPLIASVDPTEALVGMFGVGVEAVRLAATKLDEELPPVMASPDLTAAMIKNMRGRDRVADFWIRHGSVQADCVLVVRQQYNGLGKLGQGTERDKWHDGLDIVPVPIGTVRAKTRFSERVAAGDLISGPLTVQRLFEPESTQAVAILRPDQDPSRRSRMDRVQHVIDLVEQGSDLRVTSTGRDERTAWIMLHPRDQPLVVTDFEFI
jgi:hypothetical protein